MSTPPTVSFAIPVFNEEAVLPELLRRVRTVLDKLPGGPHQAVVVNDGSSDGTAAILDTAVREDPQLTVIHLSRNFGHQIALTAALDHAPGDLVLVMDGDLQDSPEAVTELMAKQAEGFDVVYAVRVERKESWWLRLCYALHYRLSGWLSSVQVPVDAGDFSLLTRRAVDAMRASRERNRYMRGLRAWVGFRQVGVEVERNARFAGRSKYTTGRLVKLALDGLFSFSVAPLRAASLLGLVAIAGSGTYAAYAVAVKLFQDRSPQGFTALVGLVVFLSGVQLVFLGVVGEYVGRIFEEVKQRPAYVVERIEKRPDG